MLLWQVDEYHGLDVTAVRCITKNAKSCKQDRDDQHDARQGTGEFLWLFHRFSDGNDPGFSARPGGGLQSDTLKGKHGRTDEKREAVAVEHDDVLGHSLGRQNGDLASSNVDD